MQHKAFLEMVDLVAQLLYSPVEFGSTHPGNVHGVLDDGVNVLIEVRANIVAMIRSKASSCLHAMPYNQKNHTFSCQMSLH